MPPCLFLKSKTMRVFWSGSPPDMRGSGGGKGGAVKKWEPFTYAERAAGGVLAAGPWSRFRVASHTEWLVRRSYRVSMVSPVGGSFLTHEAGSGGGGAPGTLMHLLDGSAVLFPILAGNIDANYGTSPITGGVADT